MGMVLCAVRRERGSVIRGGGARLIEWEVCVLVARERARVGEGLRVRVVDVLRLRDGERLEARVVDFVTRLEDSERRTVRPLRVRRPDSGVAGICGMNCSVVLAICSGAAVLRIETYCLLTIVVIGI